MVQETTRLITADELLRMPDDGYQYELVEGRLKKMPPPGAQHGALVARLTAVLTIHVEKHRLGLVTGGDTGYKLASDPDTVRAPDIAFVARHRIPKSGPPDGYLAGAPDLAVEVISPSNTRGEIAQKTAEYLESGATDVWVVEPSHRTVTVYRAVGGTVLKGTDILDGGDLLPGFRYPLERLFATW